jgi:hypothetical protein
MAVAVDFLSRFGLIQGELLSTDGQLEPSYSRYKGCTYACKDCQPWASSDKAGPSGSRLLVPFPRPLRRFGRRQPKRARLRTPW